MNQSNGHLPPWTLGCRVLTLPPNISGAPVISDTSLKLHEKKTKVLVYPVGRSSWKTVSKLTYLGNILWFMTIPATSVTCFNHFYQLKFYYKHANKISFHFIFAPFTNSLQCYYIDKSCTNDESVICHVWKQRESNYQFLNDSDECWSIYITWLVFQHPGYT